MVMKKFKFEDLNRRECKNQKKEDRKNSQGNKKEESKKKINSIFK
jgi:hypothetical protein